MSQLGHLVAVHVAFIVGLGAALPNCSLPERQVCAYTFTRTRTVSCSATEYGPFGQINNSACVASAAPCAWDYEIDVCCSTNVSKPDPRGGVMCPCVESCCAHQYSEPKISRLAVAAYDEATKICQTSGSGQQCTPFEDTLAPGWDRGWDRRAGWDGRAGTVRQQLIRRHRVRSLTSGLFACRLLPG
jgi:hypothetical protein